MRLLNSSKNEFDEMEGTAYFPYFDEKITPFSELCTH